MSTASFRIRIALGTAVLLGTAPAASLAQAWPAKPVRVIVPFAGGGPIDAVARPVMEKVGAAIGAGRDGEPAATLAAIKAAGVDLDALIEVGRMAEEIVGHQLPSELIHAGSLGAFRRMAAE
jgi:hypothetical protein